MRLAWLAKRLGANDVALALTLEASASNRFFGRQFGTFARSAPVPNIERTAARQGPGLARQGVESAPALQANAQPCQHDGTDQQEQRSQKLFNHVHLTPRGPYTRSLAHQTQAGTLREYPAPHAQQRQPQPPPSLPSNPHCVPLRRQPLLALV